MELFFWLLIMVVVLVAMAGEIIGKPVLKEAARWIFVGAIILLIYNYTHNF